MEQETKYIDLFCGIGGFHLAARQVGLERGVEMRCVLASDIDEPCRLAYEANFGIRPVGDITKVRSEDIPAHDVLLAGFPCQPFSIIGGMGGFEDTRGTLFFEIARILEAKRPKAFVLENVRMLVGHRKGRTLGRILETLHDLGYHASFKVLNALDFGLPQKRERVFIVGFHEPCTFLWPEGGIPMKPLRDLLDARVPRKYYASEYIRSLRSEWHRPDKHPTIWHENKAGNVSKHPYSCALRAGASYNYLLVNGRRRLTEREMLRLQGFPEDFRIVCNYSQTRRQAGNAVPVPVVVSVLHRVLDTLGIGDCRRVDAAESGQYSIVMERMA